MIQRELIFACSGEVSHGWDEIKLGSWRALGGALVLVAYGGFNFAGWYTGGAAAKAKEIAADAVAERLGTICVAQFNHDSDKGSKVKEMKDKDTWDKARYIEKQSWAIMPGEDKADSRVGMHAPSCFRRKRNRPRTAIAGHPN
jgi:hypothetical protein